MPEVSTYSTRELMAEMDRRLLYFQQLATILGGVIVLSLATLMLSQSRMALVAVLVVAARFVATRKPIAEFLERWEHVLFPVVLIGLGVVILVEGGAFGL